MVTLSEVQKTVGQLYSKCDTLKDLRNAVEQRLEISPEAGRQWRAAIKKEATNIATQEAQVDTHSVDSSASSVASSVHGTSPVGGHKRSRAPSPKLAAKTSTQPARAARSSAPVPTAERKSRALTAFVRAARVGPGVYSGISAPKGTSGYVTQLSAAVKAAATHPFKGTVPTKAEIQAEQHRQARLQDLEGLDTANVLGSAQRKRGRRRPAPPTRDSDTSSEESASDDSDEGSHAAPPAAAQGGSGGVDSGLFDEESD